MVAVDLGGTQMRVAVYGPDRAPAYKSIVPTPPGDPTALVSAIHSAVAEAGVPVAGAVVGVPGIVDFEEGRPLALPNLPRWEPTLSCGWLANETGLSVLLANDADLAALGEHNQAVVLHQEIIEDRVRVLGSAHPRTELSRVRLVTARRAAGAG